MVVGSVQLITAYAGHGLLLSWNCLHLGGVSSPLFPWDKGPKETCHFSSLSRSLSGNHVWGRPKVLSAAGLVSSEFVLLTQLSPSVLFWNENWKFSLGFSSKLLSLTYFESLVGGGKLGTWLAISKANILSHLVSDPGFYSLFLWCGGKEEWWVLNP